MIDYDSIPQEKINPWLRKCAESVCSRAGYGSAKDWELQRDTKLFPRRFWKQIYNISKALRNIYKRKGIMNATDRARPTKSHRTRKQ